MPEEERQFDLFHDYSESGFQGQYEQTIYYTLFVSKGNKAATATLEVKVEKQTFPNGPVRESVTRYELPVTQLAALIEKHGKRVP